MRMLVHRYGPRMRLKISSRVVVKPEKAIAVGQINIGHDLNQSEEAEVAVTWMAKTRYNNSFKKKTTVNNRKKEKNSR